MTDVRIVPAEEAHVDLLAANPRPADVLELAALGTDPAEAMRRGMRASVETLTGLVDGEPVCMFGASAHSILGGMGVPWLIGSAAMDGLTVRKALLRESRRALLSMRRRFPALLFNVVDARNTAAITWLSWLGFEFTDEPLAIGRNGEPFRMFYMRG